MAEVGIERLRAGDRQEDGAERDQADHAVAEQEVDRVDRIEGQQHLRIAGDVARRPRIAMAMNQTSVIGPNKAATLAVPRDCTANSTTRMTTVSGTT